MSRGTECFALFAKKSPKRGHNPWRPRPSPQPFPSTVWWLCMEPNRSYWVMSEAPTDHRALQAFFGQRRHTTATANWIKTEKSLQMFPGNRNISKRLKLQCWGNLSFHMKQWFRCLCAKQQKSLWATKMYLTLFKHNKLLSQFEL